VSGVGEDETDDGGAGGEVGDGVGVDVASITFGEDEQDGGGLSVTGAELAEGVFFGDGGTFDFGSGGGPFLDLFPGDLLGEEGAALHTVGHILSLTG